MSFPLSNLLLPTGVSVLEYSHQQKLLFVLVRHNGCTFCRQTIEDLKKNLNTIRALQWTPILVHLGPKEDSEILKQAFQLGDLQVVADPEQHFYQAFGAQRGSLSQVLSPKVIWKGIASKALFKHGIGKPQADVMQLGGIFSVSQGELKTVHQPQNSADVFQWNTLQE